MRMGGVGVSQSHETGAVNECMNERTINGGWAQGRLARMDSFMGDAHGHGYNRPLLLRLKARSAQGFCVRPAKV